MSGIRCPMCDCDVYGCRCEDRYGPDVTERQEYKGLTLYILNGTTERIVSGELYALDPSAAMWHETECVEPCMDRMKSMVDEWESEGMLKYLPNASVSIPGGEPGYATGDCSAFPASEAVCPRCGKTTAWLDPREYGDAVDCIHCGHEIVLQNAEAQLRRDSDVS